MSKKSKRDLDIEIISNIDDDIIEKNSKKRYELFGKIAEKRKKKKKITIAWISTAASFLLVVGIASVLIPLLGGGDPTVPPVTKQVPVYQGMTVSDEMPDIASLSAKQGGVMSQLLGDGNAYVGAPQLLAHNDIDQKDPYNRGDGNKLEDAVRDRFISVDPDKNMYYAKKNQDVYITVHVLNPDSFEILSFTLNGEKYSSYMFEEGSDMENLVLKVNVGEADGVFEYTIDSIKYVDGEEIKDVRMDGERTVNITIYPEAQPSPTVTKETVTYTNISFEVSVEDKLGLIDAESEKLYAVLYDGETLVYSKEISKNNTAVSFDNLKFNTLYQYAIVGVYDALDGNGISAHILTQKALYTPYVVEINEFAVSGRTLNFSPTWGEEYTGEKSFTSVAIYEGDELVAEFSTDTVEISRFDFGKSYILKCEYLFNGKTETIERAFNTPKTEGLERNENGEISGIGTCTDTVLYLDSPISAEAFAGNTAIKTVYTDSRVTNIGKSAFESCDLDKFEISEGVKYIDDWAFRHGSIVALNITDLKAWCNIGFNGMMGYDPSGTNPLSAAEKLYIDGVLTTELVIPQGVESIARGAFMEARMIESVTIPSGVTECGAFAFEDAYSLSKAELPETLTKIGRYAFTGTALTEISLSSKIEIIEDGVFCGCAFTSIELPSALKTIGSYAFSGTALKRVSIPSGVTSIGDSAFLGTALESISIPSGVKTIGRMAFEGCYRLKSVTLPSGIEEIGSYAFRECVLLAGNTYGNAKYLGTDTNDYFYLLAPTSTEITELRVHSSAKHIGARALEDCSLLVSVELPEGLTHIQEYAFRRCSSLEDINIPSGIESIGTGAFGGGNALSPKAYGNALYLGNADNPYVYLYKAEGKGITSLDIHASTKVIGYEAFGRCTALTSIQIPSGVITIGNHAFYGCTGLESITIPDSVTSIGNSAFNGCTGLTSVTIPNSVTSLDINAFRGCEGLTVYLSAGCDTTCWEDGWEGDATVVYLTE